MKRFYAFAVCLAIFFSFFACSRQSIANQSVTDISTITEENTQTKQPEIWQWKKDTPENQGINHTELQSIHSEFSSMPLLASVIIKNGYIIDEYYKDGYDENSLFIQYSASKSVTSALIGIAIDKGYIENVDIPISKYFPQISNFDDKRWKQITIKHLLTHTSGIKTTDDDSWNDWLNSPNWIEYIFNLPILHEPGKYFSYSTGNTHLLSAILEQATEMSMYDFGKKYLFDPVGIDSIKIDKDPQEISDGGDGMWMNVYDMAKFGRLFLDKGSWDGQQIVPKEWAEESTSVQVRNPSGYADYGYQWWVGTFGDNNYNSFFAQGYAGQQIFVIPELELIIVFTSSYNGNSAECRRLADEIVNACNQ